MQCHSGDTGNRKDNAKDAEHKSGFIQKLKNSHMFWMTLLCFIPIIMIVIGSIYLGWSNKGWITVALLALCGLSHVFMMSGDKHQH